MTELNTNEIYKLAFNYTINNDLSSHKDLLIKIMTRNKNTYTIESNNKDILINIMKRDKNIETISNHLEAHNEHSKSDEEIIRGLSSKFSSSETDKQLQNVAKHQEDDKRKEEQNIKKRIHNKIKKDYDINDNVENYSGPFSVKIYDFKDEDIIKNTIIKCLNNLNNKSSLEFNLDHTKNKFYLTEEYIIVTFYVTYKLPEIDLDDILITEQPQQITRIPSIELTTNDKKIINDAFDNYGENIDYLNINKFIESHKDIFKSIDSLKTDKIKEYLTQKKISSSLPQQAP